MSTERKPTSAEAGAEAGAAPIPLSEPTLGGNEWAYVRECLKTGWVSSAGAFVDRFESELARYVGSAHAVAVINGTAGLHTALQVAGVGSDDEVLVPSLSFIAAANAVRYCGAYPVFMDVDPGSWQLDPVKVVEFLESRCRTEDGKCTNASSGRSVRAILPVHVLGLTCDMESIAEAGARFGLAIVEDAAEGLGARYRGRHVGTFGQVGVFSFNGNKTVTSGGGGMIVTDDSELARRALYLTTQAKDDPKEYVHGEIGYNYRLSNLQAALGLAQLEQADRFIARKREIASAYRAAFEDIPGITAMPEPDGVEATFWLYTILLGPETSAPDRRAVIDRLNRDGVGARSLWHPVHTLPPYAASESYRVEHSTAIFKRAISLPSSSGMSDETLDRCIAICRRHLS